MMTDSRSGASGVRLILVAALLLGVFGSVLASPPSVYAQQAGSITFRLIIEGPVPADDDFALPRSSSECCFNDPVHVFCGAGIGTSAEPCEARTYEITYDQFSVGTEIDYAYQRWPGGNANAAETFYQGAVIVQQQAQVITVTYQYASGGTQPTPASGTGSATGATPAATTVPDTATPLPTNGSPLLQMVMVTMALLIVAGGGWLILVRRCR